MAKLFLLLGWMGIQWALALLLAWREWRAIPVENRRFQIRLSELLVAPLILTPGLAALGRGDHPILVAMLIVYPAFGALLGWFAARREAGASQSSWQAPLFILLMSYGFSAACVFWYGVGYVLIFEPLWL